MNSVALPIAFVDDDPLLLESIREFLMSLSQPQRVTSNTEECRDWVKTSIVRGVVSDLRMPGIDGVTFLEQIRAISPEVSLYILTGYEPTHEERQRLDAIGAVVKGKIEDLPDFLDELTPGTPADAARHLLTLQSKIATLETLNRDWIEDYVGHLQHIASPESATVVDSAGKFTVSELIDDVRALRPRGVEHLRLWRRAMTTLRKLGKLPR